MKIYAHWRYTAQAKKEQLIETGRASASDSEVVEVAALPESARRDLLRCWVCSGYRDIVRGADGAGMRLSAVDPTDGELRLDIGERGRGEDVVACVVETLRQAAAASDAIHAASAALVAEAREREHDRLAETVAQIELLPDELLVRRSLRGIPADHPLHAKQSDAHARLAAERKHTAAENDRQHKALVSDHGTPSQRARMAEGLLPDSELIALARRVLFAGLIQGAGENAWYESPDCGHSWGPDALSEQQYDALVAARELAPDAAKVTLRVADSDAEGCDECDAIGIRPGDAFVLVELEWAGLTLTALREVQ